MSRDWTRVGSGRNPGVPGVVGVGLGDGQQRDPEGADAVVPVENVVQHDNTIEIASAVLPTNGHARTTSAVTALDFLKLSTTARLERAALAALLAGLLAGLAPEHRLEVGIVRHRVRLVAQRPQHLGRVQALVGQPLVEQQLHHHQLVDGHPGHALGQRLAARARAYVVGTFGMQAMCEGGGIANVTIVEAL